MRNQHLSEIGVADGQTRTLRHWKYKGTGGTRALEKDEPAVLKTRLRHAAHYLFGLCNIRSFGYLSVRFDEELLFGGLAEYKIFSGQNDR